MIRFRKLVGIIAVFTIACPLTEEQEDEGNKQGENESMIKNSILQCIIPVICLAVLTSCSGNSSSDAEAEQTTSQITTVLMTDTTTQANIDTTTSTEATSETTTAVVMTAAIDTTETKTKMLDRIADSIDDPTEFTSPFGDISSAYVCIGGTALTPGVRVLSADEVKKLSKVLNSMEWSEFPDKPATPYTPGPGDLTIYVNENGRRSHLTLIDYTYRDEDGFRYFMINSPATVEESFTIYQICNDLLFTGDLNDVSTHLFMQQEISEPDGSYDINEYWDLIWDDVIQFIQDQNNKADDNQ